MRESALLTNWMSPYAKPCIFYSYLSQVSNLISFLGFSNEKSQFGNGLFLPDSSNRGKQNSDFCIIAFKSKQISCRLRKVVIFLTLW
jgi:hypothetical protein